MIDPTLPVKWKVINYECVCGYSLIQMLRTTRKNGDVTIEISKCHYCGKSPGIEETYSLKIYKPIV